MKSVGKLIKIASDPFLEAWQAPQCLPMSQVSVFKEIREMLAQKNGFLAFESALLVFPGSDVENVPGLDTWNSPRGWRRHYVGAIPEGTVFFAADAFGCQFGAQASSVVRFNPETGEIASHSTSLEHWAETILSEYDFETGWPLARDWQKENGALPRGSRLLPKQPFVLGGEFEVQNLRAIDCTKAMEKLGRLYTQIRSVPDGAHVSVVEWLE